MNTWKIEDASQLALENPTTFFIPSPDDIKSISPGKDVKLIFTSTDPEESCGERVWVQVETANDGKFTGFLNNVPGCFKDLEYGDTIAFEGKNIIDVNFSRVETDTSEPYFKGCLVPYSVLEDGEKPRFISWEPPEEEFDSGWCVLAGDGPDDPMNTTDNLTYVPLGEVVYYDNSFKHLLFLDKEISYYWDEEEQIWIEIVGD
jgi:hypothetical protein